MLLSNGDQRLTQAAQAKAKSKKMNTVDKKHRRQHLRKGQALVEMALTGILLGMLLAGAVDLGRAFYTAVVVTNMAGEGASYAAINPELDSSYPQPPTAGACSEFRIVDANSYVQRRVRQVATERGLVLHQPQDADIQVSPPCSNRCVGSSIAVTVTYRISDLFLPNLLGLNSITIKRSASQLITKNAYGASCGN